MTRTQQPSTSDSEPTLFDVWACPRCGGTGRIVDRETGAAKACRVCFATGLVTYDPADKAIPY